MKYAISREGKALGFYTVDEIRPLVSAGSLLPQDRALPENGLPPTTVAALVGPPPLGAGEPPLAPPNDGYLVRSSAQQFGPFSLAAVQQYALEKRFQPTDIAWRPGMAAWEPLRAILERHGVKLPADPESTDSSMEWLIPINRSPLAILAPYLGLFSVLLIPAPFAVIVGILALRDLKKNPTRKGAGRAWFGIIAGAIGSIFLLITIGSIAMRR